MIRHHTWVRTLAAILPALLLFTGCSVNPATGRQQINFFNEAEEIEMGREADAEIVAQVGLYDDPELQAYVEDLGQSLAARSERPDLPWSFKVLDDPAINAFALPGGYVYVTRGILSHLESEAELAMVMGHEIGHVTARHGVNQMSKQMLAMAGLGVAALLSSEMDDLAGVAALGLSLVFLKYSRDDERQADELGLRYTERASFDLREGPKVFDLLDRASRVEGVGRLPNWLSTHPDPGARRSRLQEKVAALEASGTRFEGAAVNRDSYVQLLDGMTFGENPREGFFRGGEFLHPDLRFRFRFPEGWTTANEKTSVSGQSPGEDAMIQISLAEQDTVEAAAEAAFESEGLERLRSWRREIHGSPASWNRFRLDRGQGEEDLEGMAVFLTHEGKVFQLLALSTAGGWSRHEPTAETALASFGRLTDRSALDVQPRRLEIVSLPRAMTLEEFNRQYPSTVPLDTVALANHADPATRFAAGRLVKRVVGGKGIEDRK
ncbi:MAG TPA: M48 family metalloprotease [Thermoanaerobaculia bacterium]|nr:M48 family metalloprotease [Thermoanaerobaculia bacterium]